MTLTLLTTIFLASGAVAILYSVGALFSMLSHGRALKNLPGTFEANTDKPDSEGPPAAEAFWGRAKILLQNNRLDAALVDCKYALRVNPHHAEATSLLKQLAPPEPVAAEPAEETAPAEITGEPEPKEAEPAAALQAVAEVEPAVPGEPAEETAPAEITGEPEPKEAEPAAALQAEAEVEPAEPAEEPATVEIIVEPEPEEVEKATELQAEAEVEPSVTTEPIEPVEEPATVEITIEPEPEEAEPAAALQAEAEVEPAEETAPAEITVEPRPEEAEKAAALQAEAVVEPAVPGEPAEETAPPEITGEPEPKEAEQPEVTEETKTDASLIRQPLPDDDNEAPLIPKDKLFAPERQQRKSLLEEYNLEKLKEFEEGEPGEEDLEWTRYADKKGPKPVKSKMDLNELPPEAVGLKDTLSKLQQAETYNFQGETNLSKNFYKNAIQDFSRALEINPNYVDALINRGSAYAELGQFNDALMDFNRALKFEKRDAEIFNKRGEIYLQNKMFNEAIKDFTCALVLNPMFSDAYLNRGRAYSEKGMPEEAMTDFKQAVKADSDQSFSFIDRAAPAVHISEDKSSNREEAERFNQLGSTDMQNEKFQDAIENFTKAISVASTEAEGYINRGRALLKLDKPDEALADFNEAVLFDPLNAPLYYWRAQAWGAKENHSNMKEDLKISCEMGHEPACLKYRELKSARKYPLI